MNLIEILLQEISMKQDLILARLNQPQQQKIKVNCSTPKAFKKQHMQIAESMYEIINATTTTKKPNMGHWANDIRKLNEIDGVGISKILEVFKTANKDDFWSMNVRSPKKLRKHWDRLASLRNKSLGLNTKEDTRESLDYFKEKKW
jgi:hypothetical protein